MDLSTLGASLLNDAASIGATATQTINGNIAVNNPAVIQAQTANGSLLFLLILGYILYKVIK